MAELQDKCVQPARGPIIPAMESPEVTPAAREKEVKMLVRVSKEAIDFEAHAYIEGIGFRPVRLSDYKGKWIVLCFYPGDFTSV